jgi:hypothetical protein
VSVFDGLPGGSFAPRREIEFTFPRGHRWIHGKPRPVLVDWDRDAHTDLLVAFVNCHSSCGLYLCRGPLAGRDKLVAETVALPGDPRVTHYAVVDWDGDGRFDLLAAPTAEGDYGYRGGREIVWFRNTAATGEPVFDAPRAILTVPDPWRIDGFAPWVAGPGRPPGLVLGVNGLRYGADGKQVEPVPCQLWRYRRQ